MKEATFPFRVDEAFLLSEVAILDDEFANQLSLNKQALPYSGG